MNLSDEFSSMSDHAGRQHSVALTPEQAVILALTARVRRLENALRYHTGGHLVECDCFDCRILDAHPWPATET